MKKTLLTAAFLGLLGVALAQSGFQYEKNINPLTDEDDSYIYTVGTGTNGDPGTLAFHCFGKDISVTLLTKTYLGSNNFNLVSVEYRFDKLLPSIEQWSSAFHGQGAAQNDTISRIFLRVALKHSKLIFGITDFGGENHYYFFNIGGLSEALSQLSCYP